MTDHEKKVVLMTVIFLVLIAFAWHSLFLLSLARRTPPALAPAAPVEAAPETPSPIATAPGGASLRILTDEEIQARIAEKQHQLETLKALMAARQKKADAVIALARQTALNPPEQGDETVNTKPKPPTDAQKERTQEILHGVQSHQYFAH